MRKQLNSQRTQCQNIYNRSEVTIDTTFNFSYNILQMPFNLEECDENHDGDMRGLTTPQTDTCNRFAMVTREWKRREIDTLIPTKPNESYHSFLSSCRKKNCHIVTSNESSSINSTAQVEVSNLDCYSGSYSAATNESSISHPSWDEITHCRTYRVPNEGTHKLLFFKKKATEIAKAQ